MASSKTILYTPSMKAMAESLASEMGNTVTLCTTELKDAATMCMCMEAFPSGDPNIKLRIDSIRDRDVVLLFAQDSSANMF